MQIGMIGLGRMGANMVRRFLRAGHDCVVFDRSAKAVKELVNEHAAGAADLKDLVQHLQKPGAIWLMVPAAAVDPTISKVNTWVSDFSETRSRRAGHQWSS
jgi:6-phosphogluconate dehydrogenase